MDQWSRASGLSPARRPQLLEKEELLAEVRDVVLYDGSKRVKGRDGGVLFVTGVRLLWVGPDAKSDRKAPPCQLALRVVSGVAAPAPEKKETPKVRLEFAGGKYCQLGFRGQGQQVALQRIQGAVQARAWDNVTSRVQSDQKERGPAGGAGAGAGTGAGAGAGAGPGAGAGVAARPKKEFSTRGAGISGIMDQMDKKHQATNATMQVAFGDLDSLMAKAADMVKIADAFAAKQAAANKGAETDGADEMRAMLTQLGISAPVTKDAAGSQYHQQLARQLADWLGKFLDARFNGMIALTDLYCLFNRARGTEMISPEDLTKACKEFERLKLPLRLRKFGSGVTVVVSAAHSDEAVAADLSALVKRDGPITAYEVAMRKKIPLPLAQEQLFSAERTGALCRDETVDGLTFYLNFFEDMKVLSFHLDR